MKTTTRTRELYEESARAALNAQPWAAAVPVTDEMVACLADALQEQAAQR